MRLKDSQTGTVEGIHRPGFLFVNFEVEIELPGGVLEQKGAVGAHGDGDGPTPSDELVHPVTRLLQTTVTPSPKLESVP